MSGHSHSKTVKHTKDAADAKKSKQFSKLSQEIIIAAKTGGDPETNSVLKQILSRARSVNMPSGSIERAIKKGTGELAGGEVQEALYEAYGPGGIALLIEAITDNKNRTVGDIKLILPKHNGKLADSGSVKWLFEKLGVVSVTSEKRKEDVELLAIDAGAEDVKWEDDSLYIYVKPEGLGNITKALLDAGLNIESSSQEWVPKDCIKVSEKDTGLSERLFEALSEISEVQDVYSNIL